MQKLNIYIQRAHGIDTISLVNFDYVVIVTHRIVQPWNTT